jgi:hypothetical protein
MDRMYLALMLVFKLQLLVSPCDSSPPSHFTTDTTGFSIKGRLAGPAVHKLPTVPSAHASASESTEPECPSASSTICATGKVGGDGTACGDVASSQSS